MNSYDVIIKVQHSTMARIEASTEQEAIEKAKQMFYNGEIMDDLADSDYFDGITDVIAEDTL